MSKKVLIIEDYPATTEMIATHLKLEGFEVIAAYGGTSGLRKAASERPDLVLLDIMMPEMSGFEVCKRLKDNPKTSRIPVVIVSVKAADKDVRMTKEAGAVDYVKKPFEPSQLIETIKKYI